MCVELLVSCYTDGCRYCLLCGGKNDKVCLATTGLKYVALYVTDYDCGGDQRKCWSKSVIVTWHLWHQLRKELLFRVAADDQFEEPDPIVRIVGVFAAKTHPEDILSSGDLENFFRHKDIALENCGGFQYEAGISPEDRQFLFDNLKNYFYRSDGMVCINGITPTDCY